MRVTWTISVDGILFGLDADDEGKVQGGYVQVHGNPTIQNIKEVSIRGGGLLVVFCKEIIGEGTMLSYGDCWSFYVSGYTRNSYETMTGGGSINIFAKNELKIDKSSCNVTSESDRIASLIGASGTVTIGTIKTGVFIEL